MLNLKIATFIGALIASAIVGAIGTKLVINVWSPAPVVQPAPQCPQPMEKETFRHQEPVNSGRHKEY
ncbi:hypothetical protein [Klebsiella pneumoniae]|nr:hypothetical protein [Salmonella enterica subsp. enterica serovar Enteritidis]EIY7949903.1 hypothetical protein [Salmonella enterica]EMB3728219.1 hypothetical protein [Escherichia coli]HAN9276636.1 hypothetical protein [Escherichia coli]HAO0780913.1 hypothetical protein [Escherichia coli]